MSTIVHEQDYTVKLDRLKLTVISELENAISELRETGKSNIYLGGTTFAKLDFNEGNVIVEA